MADARNGAAPPDDRSGLVVRGLVKSYRRNQVVRSVDLELKRGEAVGLLGPNGAGKTTTFYMITGLVQADQGQIEIDGEDVTEEPMYRRARRGLGYLPQEASIFRGLSVTQNIMAVLELVESDKSVREERLEALLDEFSVTHLRDTPAVALSGGERRRVEIARCLASNPSFILLDEPFAGVDAATERAILDVLERTKDSGRTLLVVHHDLATAAEYFDSLVLLKQRLYAYGPPQLVLNRELLSQVYEGNLRVFDHLAREGGDG